MLGLFKVIFTNLIYFIFMIYFKILLLLLLPPGGTLKCKAIISNGNTRWYFNTIVHPDLNPYAQLFYQPSSVDSKNNKFLKIMPYDFTPDFNETGSACRYMGVGSLKSNKKAYILCTPLPLRGPPGGGGVLSNRGYR